MKIKPEDIKVGLVFKSYDVDDQSWWKTEVLKIENDKIYLKDIDDRSSWKGMEWEVSLEDIQDVSLYKILNIIF